MAGRGRWQESAVPAVADEPGQWAAFLRLAGRG